MDDSWRLRTNGSALLHAPCQVGIRVGDRVIRGRTESLDADGALLLRTEHGTLERIIGGDVSVEKPE